MSADNQLLEKSLESAWLNVAGSVLLRLVSFASNAVALRHVEAEYLGLVVRLALFAETALFLSREHFRRACLAKPSRADGWPAVLNLVWLCVPLGAAIGAALLYVWLEVLEAPSERFLDQYRAGMYVTFGTVLLVLLSEPFYIVGQAYMHVRFRTFADLTFMVLGQLLSVFFVVRDPGAGVWVVSLVQLFNGAVFLALHVGYFHKVLKRRKKEGASSEGGDTDLPMTSLTSFLPSVPKDHQSAGFFDQTRLQLSLSFFKQGFLKQLLTDGEKYMFTWFSLMTLAEQGIFDVVANLGAIPARLLFSKLEESAHLYFSQMVTRGSEVRMDSEKEVTASRHLASLLRYMLLLGLVICAFGLPYSHLLLHLYGGPLLTPGLGPPLLRAHCVSILFLAFNGVSECYAFNVMTSAEVDAYNYLMTLMTAAFLALTWALAQVLGPVGFTVANCCNFSMRIAHNVAVIRRRHRGSTVLPNLSVCLALLASAAVCQVSEWTLYDPATLLGVLGHLIIGGVMFLVTVLSILRCEPAAAEKISSYYKKFVQPLKQD